MANSNPTKWRQPNYPPPAQDLNQNLQRAQNILGLQTLGENEEEADYVAHTLPIGSSKALNSHRQAGSHTQNFDSGRQDENAFSTYNTPRFK